jgi:hypothetical protein
MLTPCFFKRSNTYIGDVVSSDYRNFQKRMFVYLCVVMKHPTDEIGMTNFQRDPSVSLLRVSPYSDAWRALIDLFDQRGVGLIVDLLANLLDSQGETKSIDAFLQYMLYTTKT